MLKVIHIIIRQPLIYAVIGFFWKRGVRLFFFNLGNNLGLYYDYRG